MGLDKLPTNEVERAVKPKTSGKPVESSKLWNKSSFALQASELEGQSIIVGNMVDRKTVLEQGGKRYMQEG